MLLSEHRILKNFNDSRYPIIGSLLFPNLKTLKRGLYRNGLRSLLYISVSTWKACVGNIFSSCCKIALKCFKREQYYFKKRFVKIDSSTRTFPNAEKAECCQRINIWSTVPCFFRRQCLQHWCFAADKDRKPSHFPMFPESEFNQSANTVYHDVARKPARQGNYWDFSIWWMVSSFAQYFLAFYASLSFWALHKFSPCARYSDFEIIFQLHPHYKSTVHIVWYFFKIGVTFDS